MLEFNLNKCNLSAPRSLALYQIRRQPPHAPPYLTVFSKLHTDLLPTGVTKGNCCSIFQSSGRSCWGPGEKKLVLLLKSFTGSDYFYHRRLSLNTYIHSSPVVSSTTSNEQKKSFSSTVRAARSAPPARRSIFCSFVCLCPNHCDLSSSVQLLLLSPFHLH